MPRPRHWFPLALVLLAPGCSDAPTIPTAEPPALQVTPGGNGFYFLKPTVPAAPETFPGVFDPNRQPVVQIVCTGAAHDGCPVLAAFDRSATGTGRVAIELERYQADWTGTGSLRLGQGKYRLEVRDGGTLLGAGDLWVVSSSAGLKEVTSDHLGVVRGSTFRIRFRIETTAGGADQLPGLPGDPAAGVIPNRVPTVNLAEYDGNHPDLPGFPMSFTTALLITTPAATVGEINAVLGTYGARILGGFPGVSGKAGGSLVVRFPTATHAELDALLAQVRARPGIAAAVADHVVRSHIAPANDPSASWVWSLLPQDGNWGMEAIRAPALWNLNDYVRKSGRRAETAIIDTGFIASHLDLVIGRNLSPTVQANHGTHVAGIIGATFDNHMGVDGVNPFANLSVLAVGPTSAQVLVEFCGFLVGPPVPVVVNVSLGYDWDRHGINTTTNLAARAFASADGLVVTACLAALATEQSLPYVVASAGNDYHQDAQWASPWNAAAFLHNAAPVIVVEAADEAAAPQLADFSNLNGHVSAPGVRIMSTAFSAPYLPFDGTSMAAPHVAGLVGYLTALAPSLGAPTMTSNPLRTLLNQTGQLSTGGMAPRIDAFAAAIELDRLLGGTQILRALADIDDGSSDGNRRVDANGVLDLNEDADGDGGRGDGRVDMADFRRFRDWLLDAEQAPGLALDGPLNIIKLDQNGDSVYRSNSFIFEGDFSRGDLNGDGKIHRTQKALLGGAVGASVTDLEVLMRVFSDPVYGAVELPGLLDSGDITVEAGACIDAVSAVQVDVAVQIASDTTRVVRSHRFSAVGREIVFTVPTDAAGYALRLAVLDGAGNVLKTETGTSGPVRLGSDAFFLPTCSGAVGFGPVSFPTGQVGVPYNAQLSGAGGDGTYAYSVVSGMPPGLNVLGDKVTGTPTQAGTFQLTLRITSAGQSATASFTVKINAINQDPLLDPGNTPSKWQIVFANGQCCGQVLLAQGTLGPGRYQLVVSSLTTCFLLLATPGSLPSTFTGTCSWTNGFPNQPISGIIDPQGGSGTVQGGNGRHWVFGQFTLKRL